MPPGSGTQGSDSDLTRQGAPRTRRALPGLVVGTLAVAAIATVSEARGQPASAADTGAHTALWRVGGFVGIARNSPAGSSALGDTPGRNHFFLGLDAVTPVLRVGPLEVAYGVQLLPVVVVGGRSAYAGYHGSRAAVVAGPSRAYAFGASPFGFELGTRASARVALFGAAAAGGLWFDRPFPVPEARRFNFTLEYGGARYFASGGRSG